MSERNKKDYVVIKVLQTCFITHCRDIDILKSNLPNHQERKEELLKSPQNKDRKLKL
jgi:hypothetical protein